MPTYEYRCNENPDHKYVEVRSINVNVSRETCDKPGCQGRLIRVFSAPPITFSGSGFNAKKG
jgi:putative FmdB family regulatory protein